MIEALELIPTGKHATSFPRLPSGREYIIGVDASCHIVISGDGVLPRHARLLLEREQAFLKPVDSAQVIVNGERIEGKHFLNHGDWVIIGKTVFQLRFHRMQSENAPSPDKRRISIGRAADSDIGIDSPLVSREHAVILFRDGGWLLQDFGSTNGTYLNGNRVVGAVSIREGDRVDIATFGFVFHESALRPMGGDRQGQVAVAVRGLTREVADRATGKPRYLLSDIDFVIEPGEFVAIFGTSGSGKSTLLDALSGRRAASTGEVTYNGENLYRNYDRFREAIGYVPQQDIVHRKIRVRKALEYTARLRLPPDMQSDEIAHHVGRVLKQVGLAEKADLAVDTPEPLSGGQLKRVSLGVELVANPNILFLDEVTSGLDAGTDKRMMQLFSGLAHEHKKTVICVTHTLENIEHCDQVVLMHQGRLVYFGPPGEARAHFGIEKLSEVYDLLESKPAEFWARRYTDCAQRQRFVTERLDPDRQSSAPAPSPDSTRTARVLDLRQTRTLLARYLDLLGADMRNLFILFAQAPLIGALVGLVFANDGVNPVEEAYSYGNTLFIMVLSAIWFGCLNSAKEVVKELPIYLRERSINLGIGSYLASKMIPLTALALLQCLFLVASVEAFMDMPGNMASRFATLVVVEVAATLMGLTVSTLVNTNDKAVGIIPILLIPQVVLSGAIVNLNEFTTLVAKGTMIAYWGFDAMKSSLPKDILDMVANPANPSEKILPLMGTWNEALAALTLMSTAFLIAAVVGLRLHDGRVRG
uniref:FHA modulated ABC efflux pump with fused ATPase and integral membrane subunits n=1 Tax=Candidatus Kentrum sp. LFY TaxID=2126342 RepID=A0A450U668_9GAMM|nr:MAG: FHA modulated ABC efflux pump with fused ATPase and integral membrane subunits [Candidatus Kentron sp. LFY]